MDEDQREIQYDLSSHDMSALEGLVSLARLRQHTAVGDNSTDEQKHLMSVHEECHHGLLDERLQSSPLNKSIATDRSLHLGVSDAVSGVRRNALGDRNLDWKFEIEHEDRLSELDAFAKLELAIQMMEPMEKADYLEALRVAPHLVMIESNPGKFLRHSSYNAVAAAQGIVRYWKRRREVFRERAFLPMTITGDGALSQDAIDFLHGGNVAFLPCDSGGRTVLFVQPCRRLQDNLDLRLRVSFYYGQLMAENRMSQKDGYVMIVTISDIYYDPYMTECKNLVMNTFPIKSYSWHIFKLLSSITQNRYLDGFVDRIVKMHSHLFRGYRTFIHPTQKKSEMLDSLAKHGFQKEDLPYCIGGKWEYSDFSLWIRDRLEYERVIYSAWESNSGPQKLTLVPPTVHVAEYLTDSHPIANAVVVDEKFSKGEDHNSATYPSQSPLSKVTWNYLQYSRRMFYKSIDLLCQSEKTAYLEALKHASSDILSRESDVDLFLKTESYHPVHTAKRCARYWQLRNQTFGSSKHDWLYQTGEHALGRKDLVLLQSGFCMLLPNDTEGSSVLSIDLTLLPKGISDSIIKRCLF